MAARFVADYGLPEYDAGQLTQGKAVARYFEAVAEASKQPKLASNWVMGEVTAYANREDLAFNRVSLNPRALAKIISKIADGTINNASAKLVFAEVWARSKLLPLAVVIAGNLPDAYSNEFESDKAIDAIIEAKGLKQLNDTSALEKIIDDVLAANAKNVAEFKAGNAKAFNALVGQAMKATQGKANPAQVNALLKTKLG